LKPAWAAKPGAPVAIRMLEVEKDISGAHWGRYFPVVYGFGPCWST
jgi:hypothetical protein